MADYALELSEAELNRYRFMAEEALETEGKLWTNAGIGPGVRVADVGCGPGAMSVRLAELVGPDGEVWGIDQNPEALAIAEAMAGKHGLTNVRFTQASATESGIEPGWADVAMLRHVLAHNGASEQAIVDHLATLVRPGGCVYLVDIEASSMRMRPSIPELEELNTRYTELHALRGNDLSVGLRLDELLKAAGLEVIEYEGRYNVITPPPGMRPPAWAARDALIAEGLATQDDLERWNAALERLERGTLEIKAFLAAFFAVGRRPA